MIARLKEQLSLPLVSAPAGFGKTTLLGSWFSMQTQRHACALART
ncbi:MAG TPA: hypothetical protein VHZ51_14105 [Ktedonobacteraceae bacterium]|nr:hypothetical protein [Ktedonobacteraceae bacterium]